MNDNVKYLLDKVKDLLDNVDNQDQEQLKKAYDDLDSVKNNADGRSKEYKDLSDAYKKALESNVEKEEDESDLTLTCEDYKDIKNVDFSQFCNDRENPDLLFETAEECALYYKKLRNKG